MGADAAAEDDGPIALSSDELDGIVADSREVTPPTFDEVKEQLAVQVRRDKVQAAIEKRVTDSKVEKTEGLAPDLLNKTDLLGE